MADDEEMPEAIYSGKIDQHTAVEPLRHRILHDHLLTVARKHPASSLKISPGLTYEATLALAGPLPGGLATDDLRRHNPTSLQLDSRIQAQLASELKKTLLTISDFYYGGTDVNESERERLDGAFRLPEAITSRNQRLLDLQEELDGLKTRIQLLVQECNEVHPRLESSLTAFLQDLSPHILTERTLRSEVLAITIETCLLKLSLLRAKLQSSIYSYALPPPSAASSKIPTAPQQKEKTLRKAIENFHSKLVQKQREQDNEEKKLDEQIEEFEKVLSLVDRPIGRPQTGSSIPRGTNRTMTSDVMRKGGFAQVVEDMAKVRKETEECRRDLRRLGWSGD